MWIRRNIWPILPTVVPAGFIGVLYLLLFGYRGDYLGHYAAGFGATLAVLAISVEKLPDNLFVQRCAGRVLLMTAGCIVAGAFAEATVFNIAKFDEVDFCNQSLGAILAGMGFLANLRGAKADGDFFRAECYAGLIALHLGFYFAMF
ncbi:MAG TPA: hypothetical protein VGH74_02660 [Planctomycetaceae bacterium]|jgi:hypothetical protein